MQLDRERFGWKAVSITVLALGGLGLALYWRQSRLSEGSAPPAPAQSNLTAKPQIPSNDLITTAAMGDSLRKRWDSLKAAPSPEAARTVLAELRSHLASLPASVASKTIRDILDSKEDAQTRLKFAVGADAFLTESPSLRTFLLDQLARVDPAAAAAYAETILSTMSSPDEWALALRSYALGSTTSDARSFLEQKMQTLLQYEPWQKEPSVGYLESFDVAVHLGGTNLMPALTTLVRKTDNQAVAHAAYLALDRLAIADPLATLTKLQTDPDLMTGREATRANYFARADAGDTQQRTLLENYLLNPQLNAAELTTFTGLYPNANYMVSYNLLTRTQTPDHETLSRRDRAALQAVESWLADARFESLKSQLQTMKNRLETFVKQAGGGK
jgi:hypothetical protein